MRFSTIFLLALLAAGCAASSASSGEEKAAAPDAARRLQYRGFSVAPPPSKGWEFREGEQDPARALFRKPPLSPTHSILVQVQLHTMKSADETIERFGEQLAATRFSDKSRYEIVKLEQAPDASWGAGCFRYRVDVIDRKAPVAAGAPLTVVEQGFNCPHPHLKRMVLSGLCSERGRSEELDVASRAEGEAFLRGVRPEELAAKPGA